MNWTIKGRRGTLSVEQVLKFLKDIEDGEITLTPGPKQGAVYKAYLASNGWYMVIFDDCGEWDYVEFIVTPSGRTHDFWDTPDGSPLQEYEPPDVVQRLAYQWP